MKIKLRHVFKKDKIKHKKTHLKHKTQNMNYCQNIKQDPINAYLIYFNDFLTVKRFAEYYQIEIEYAKKLIAQGRKMHLAQ